MVHAFSLESVGALVVEVENLLIVTGEQEARLSRVSSLLLDTSSASDGAAALLEQASTDAREHRLRLRAALDAIRGVACADPAKQNRRCAPFRPKWVRRRSPRGPDAITGATAAPSRPAR